MNANDAPYDVVVIGGGPAGLNAAVMLGRARRRVAVIDNGEPRNAPASGVHGFLSHDGIAPAELIALGRAEATKYGAELVTARATLAVGDLQSGFTVTLEDGRTARSRRLLVTTGLVDDLPELPGLRERWGKDVLHCPYCHGWDYRDEAIGILATTRFAAHQAQQFRQWTPNVTLLLNDRADLTANDAARLAARGIDVIDGPVTGLEVRDGRLHGVRIDEGTGDGTGAGSFVPLRALAVSPRFIARSGVLAGLGIRPDPHPLGIDVGEFVTVGQSGRTSVPGVWAAGNVTSLQSQVVNSAAAGAQAAVDINADLIDDDIEQALTITSPGADEPTRSPHSSNGSMESEVLPPTPPLPSSPPENR